MRVRISSEKSVQILLIDRDPGSLHLGEHGNQRDFDVVEERFLFVFA